MTAILFSSRHFRGTACSAPIVRRGSRTVLLLDSHQRPGKPVAGLPADPRPAEAVRHHQPGESSPPQFAFNIFFVVYLKWGVTGIAISSISSSGIFAICLSVFSFVRAGVRYDFSPRPAHDRLQLAVVGRGIASLYINSGIAYIGAGATKPTTPPSTAGIHIAARINILKIYDLSDPAHPKYIMDFGYPGQKSGARPSSLPGTETTTRVVPPGCTAPNRGQQLQGPGDQPDIHALRSGLRPASSRSTTSPKSFRRPTAPAPTSTPPAP